MNLNLNIDDYEKRTGATGYWNNSSDYFYKDLEEKWRGESYPGFEHGDSVYADKTLLLELFSQNCYDWNHYVKVPRFEDATLSTLKGDFLKATIGWITKSRSDTPNLVFVGDNGSGKTHAAYAAARFMMLHGVNKETLYMPNTLVLECVDAHNTLDGWSRDQDAAATVDKYKNIPLLLLDDLGAVATSAQAAIANIVTIVAHRYNMNLPTISTSNMKPDELVDMYGSTSIRRIITTSSIVHYS